MAEDPLALGADEEEKIVREEILPGYVEWGVNRVSSFCVLVNLLELVSSKDKDRLAGLVVKASASGAEDPGFESR